MNFFNIIGVGIMQIAGGTILKFAGRADGGGAFANLFLIYAILVGISVAAFAFAKDTPRHTV
jgi:hypothetical protein